MKKYRHILLALDLHPENDYFPEQRAVELQRETGAMISLIHAVEYVSGYGAAFAYPALSDIQTQLLDEAKKRLAQCGQRLDVPEQNRYIEVGSPKPVILGAAKELAVDLIIVGSHSRHGFHLFLSGTAETILHDSPCDVLAVRIKDEVHV